MAVIRAKQESFCIDYSSEKLPALFSKRDTDSDFSEDLLQLSIEDIKKEIAQVRLTLLIATEQLKNQSLIQALQEKADSGVRVYLLLGDAKINQAAIDALSGRCLIRTGVSQKGGVVLVDHTTHSAKGLLAMSQQLFTEGDGESWSIQLETQQIEDTFRSFCKLFWGQSQSEYLLQNKPQPKAVHPDGDIVTNHSHQLCGTLKDYLGETLADLKGATHSAFDADTSQATHRLLLSADVVDIETIRPGVALTNVSIPSLLISEQGSWLLPDSSDFKMVNWCLRLSKQQGQRLAECYERSFEAAAWQYEAETLLERLEHKQEVRFADQSDLVRQIERKRDKQLEPVLTQTIDSFLNEDPSNLAQSQIGWQRDFLAHEIDYEIMIHPPYCPKTAKLDELYVVWNKTEEDWQKRLSILERQQITIDQKQAGISDKFEGFLKSFLLGQNQSVKKLNKELTDLSGWSATRATPAEREEYRKRLEMVTKQVQSRGKSTVTELDKAEQNQQWEEKKQQLRKQHDDVKKLLTEKQGELEVLTSSKPQKQSDVEKSFIQSWKGAVESLSEKQLKDLNVQGIKLEQFIPEEILKNKDEKHIREQANKDFMAAIKSELLGMDYNTADKCRQSIKEKAFKKHYKEMSLAFEDYQQALQKIERDLKSSNDNVEKTQRALAGAEESLENHGVQFEYRTSNEFGALEKQLRLKPPEKTNSSFTWPEQDLPAEGSELKVEGKQHWLVINDSDQLVQARKDAERLNAIICVNDPAL